MNYLGNSPIRYKLLFIILLTVVVSLMLVMGGITVYEVSTYRTRATAELSQLGEFIAANSAPSIAFHDTATAYEVLSTLKASPEIQIAVLYLPGNQVFASFRSVHHPAATTPQNTFSEGVRFTASQIELVQPVRQKGHRLGTLYIRSDIAPVYSRLKNYYGILLVVTFATVSWAFVLQRLLDDLLSKPLLQLSAAAERAAAGDLQGRVAVRSGDEIGQLAKAFNHMTSELSGSYERLAQREREYRTLAENAPEAICRFDRKFRHTYVNEYGAKIHGMPKEEILGKTNADLGMAPDKAAFWDQRFKEVFATGGQQTVDFDLVIPNLAHRYYSSLFVPEFDEKGTVDSILTITRDVTEMKRAEESLRKNEERFRRLIDISAQIVWVMDAKGHPTEDSPSWRTFTGRTVEEWMSGDWLGSVHPEDRDLAAAAFRRALESRVPLRAEFRMLDKNGNFRDTLAHAAPVFNDDGTVREWIGMNTDITKRKRAEEALLRSERTLAQAGKMASLGAWEIEFMNLEDIDANPLRWSEETYRIFGYNPGEVDVSNTLFFNRVHPRDRQKISDAVAEAIKGKRVYETEHRIIRADGVERVVNEYGEITFDDKGRPQRMIGAIQDITEQKRSEERLRKLTEDLKRSNADLRQFAYVASHDLQTPLRNVEGFSKMLTRRYRDKLNEKGKEIVDYITAGVRQMERQILDILEYSKIESESRSFLSVDSLSCIRDAMSTLAALISEKKANITIVEPMPFLIGDPVQLTSLFENLLENALKFNDREPEMRISAERGTREYIFSVKDNGIGIEPEQFDRIFDIFYRVHGKALYPGTGVGLAICKRIVERHGGRMWVESQPGRGSTFFFTIPIKELPSD